MVTQYYCICVFSESKSLRLQWSRLSYLWDLQLFRVSTAKSLVRMCFKGNGSCFVCKQAQVKLDIYTDRFSANDLLRLAQLLLGAVRVFMLIAKVQVSHFVHCVDTCRVSDR